MSEYRRGGPKVSYSEVVCPCSHLSHCCETWFPLANFFLLGPTLSQFFLVTKAVTVLFIWKNALFTFLILQRLSASICHSVSFMHWLQIDFVLCLNCTLPSPPITTCTSQLHLLHQSHWEKAVSQLGLSSLVVCFKKKKKNCLKVYLTFLNNA